jgi:hypothetical protein
MWEGQNMFETMYGTGRLACIDRPVTCSGKSVNTAKTRRKRRRKGSRKRTYLTVATCSLMKTPTATHPNTLSALRAVDGAVASLEMGKKGRRGWREVGRLSARWEG